MANEETSTENTQISPSLRKKISDYYLKDSFSNVRFVVEDEIFPAHKIILAINCEYFQTILLDNPQQDEITINDVKPNTFREILKYIYTGDLNINFLKDSNLLFDAIKAAHRYSLKKLRTELIEEMSPILNLTNIAIIFNFVNCEEIEELRQVCYDFIDKNVIRIWDNECITAFSQTSLVNMLGRDVFAHCQMKNLKMVEKWCKKNYDENDMLKKCIQLKCFTVEEITTIIKPMQLFEESLLLEVISEIRSTEPRPPRGLKVPDVNIASYETEKAAALLTAESDEAGFNGITLDLGDVWHFNYIKFTLEEDSCYYIQISTDKQTWHNVVDYRDYLCYSVQNVYFAEQIGKYIRILHNTGVFCVQDIEVYFKKTIPSLINQIVRPQRSLSIERMKSHLINGRKTGPISEIYIGGILTINLGQPYMLSKIQFSTTHTNYKIWILGKKSSSRERLKRIEDLGVDGKMVHKFEESVVNIISIGNIGRSCLLISDFECS